MLYKGPTLLKIVLLLITIYVQFSYLAVIKNSRGLAKRMLVIQLMHSKQSSILGLLCVSMSRLLADWLSESK